MRKPAFIMVACLLFLASCGIFNKNLELAVQPDEYQAFFISFDEKTVTPIQEILKKEQVVADIWFETQDPEIGTLGDEFEDLAHKGEPTQVAVYEQAAYKDLKNIPASIQWKDYIASGSIEKGMVFLVKASSGNVFKVKLKGQIQMSF